jgi:glycosyltransferase involved in cell wall biosynthesis
MTLRFHILGLPHTVSSPLFNACAYTQKVVKFGKMMKDRGHTIIHYGHEDSDLVCSEHVTVLKNEDFLRVYGSHDWKSKFFKYDLQDDAYQTFFKNAITEIQKRKQPNDFLLAFWGHGVRAICDAHPDMIVVEPGIGYAGGHFARWKIWESYAIYHASCGLSSVSECKQDNYSVVIPNYFDKKDFTFKKEKKDYFLYLGRVYNGKGVNIAIEACIIAGVKLIIAGQKEEGYELPDNPKIEYIGYADIEKRKELMSNAKASLIPSQYVEPFGGVQIENLLSGTPTITTDWGSFAENNLHGITGYRCRTMGDYVDAIKNIDKISPENCRIWGENFLLENVAPRYEKYFLDVLDVYSGKGWYSDGHGIQALSLTYPLNHNPLENKLNFINNDDMHEEEKKGISFFTRVHNEEESLEPCITSLFSLTMPIEINIILHNCTDRSEDIAKKLQKLNPDKNIQIHYYRELISKAGYENLCTDESSQHSYSTYNNFCLSKCTLAWIYKFDADFIMSSALANFLNEMIPTMPKNKKIRISAKNSLHNNKEFYLSDSFIKYEKYLFWEVPVFKAGTTEIELDDELFMTHYLHSIDDRKGKGGFTVNPKFYWKRTPWFENDESEEAIKVKSKMLYLELKFGKEPLALASASNPECTKYIQLFLDYFKTKNNFINIYS